MSLVSIKREYIKAKQLIKTVTASGTPEAIASEFTQFSHAIFIGLKAARTPNTGRVYLGVSSANDSQPITLDASETKSISAAPGVIYSLHEWYLDVATNGDGVVVIYA